MLTSVDLKRKAILAFTGVNLAVNLASGFTALERRRNLRKITFQID